jgi:hypothetical protein
LAHSETILVAVGQEKATTSSAWHSVPLDWALPAAEAVEPDVPPDAPPEVLGAFTAPEAQADVPAAMLSSAAKR